MIQLADDSSSTTAEGTVSISTGDRSLCPFLLPGKLQLCTAPLGFWDLKKEVLLCFSLDQGFDLAYAGREQEAFCFKGNLSFQFNPVFLGMPGS